MDNPEAVEKNAYFAGIVDGEGCIHVDRRLAPNGRPRYTVTLEISMCSKEVIFWIHENFGGSVRLAKPYGTRKRRQYHLRFWNDDAVVKLLLIYPYLKFKKRQAALLMKFRETMKQQLYSRDAHRYQLLADLRNQIHSLNYHKGDPLEAVETVRDDPQQADMIQSDLHGNVQLFPKTGAN